MRQISYLLLSLLLISSFSYATKPDPRFAPDPAGSISARNKVSLILVETYQRVLKSGEHSAFRLTNAPISGRSDKRGRHLLSFAAFNGMPILARWGLDHEARINVGDKDNATMLRMALGNFNINMVRFALRKGANPNMQMGSGNDTMLSALLKWEWPESGFYLARQYKAKPRTEEERQKVLDYLQTLLPDAEDTLINYFSSAPLIKAPVISAV